MSNEMDAIIQRSMTMQKIIERGNYYTAEYEKIVKTLDEQSQHVSNDVVEKCKDELGKLNQAAKDDYNKLTDVFNKTYNDVEEQVHDAAKIITETWMEWFSYVWKRIAYTFNLLSNVTRDTFDDAKSKLTEARDKVDQKIELLKGTIANNQANASVANLATTLEKAGYLHIKENANDDQKSVEIGDVLSDSGMTTTESISRSSIVDLDDSVPFDSDVSEIRFREDSNASLYEEYAALQALDGMNSSKITETCDTLEASAKEVSGSSDVLLATLGVITCAYLLTHIPVAAAATHEQCDYFCGLIGDTCAQVCTTVSDQPNMLDVLSNLNRFIQMMGLSLGTKLR